MAIDAADSEDTAAVADAPGPDALEDTGGDTATDLRDDAGVDAGIDAGVDTSDEGAPDEGTPDGGEADAAQDSVADATPDADPDILLDTGPDILLDTGPDILLDTGPDVLPDIPLDTGPDVLLDTGPDVLPDTPLDTGPDVLEDVDTADTPPDEGGCVPDCDGKTCGGDGCGGTCGTAPCLDTQYCDASQNCAAKDPQLSCNLAIPAAIGVNLGDTTDGLDMTDASCTAQGSASGSEKVHLLVVPGTAEETAAVTLTLASATDQGVSVRSTCSDVATELGCADAVAGGQDEVLVVSATPGDILAIVVEAGSPGAEGPYSLTVAVELTGPNECLGQGGGNDCAPEAVCTDTPDSFQCACSTGFSGSGKACECVNEQLLATNVRGVAVAPDGTLYIADLTTNTVRRLPVGGAWQTVTDSLGSTGAFKSALNVGVSPDGALYVSDSTAGQVKRLSGPDGLWELVTDSEGANFGFTGASGIGFAPDGTLFISSTSPDVVWRLAPGGVWETVTDAMGSDGGFTYPRGLYVGPGGDLWVAAEQLKVVKHLPPGGMWTVVVDAAGGTGGFGTPVGLTGTPDGVIYVGDFTRENVKRLVPGGVWETVATFKAPNWLALSPDETGLYVGVPGKGPYLVGGLDTGGCPLEFGEACTGNFQCASDKCTSGFCYDACLDFGVANVCHPTAVCTASGNSASCACPAGSTGDGFDCTCRNGVLFPLAGSGGVAVADDGRVYVASMNTSAILSRKPGGSAWGEVHDASGGAGAFGAVFGVAVAPGGALLVTDTLDKVVKRLEPGGDWTVVVDSAGSDGALGGPAGVAASEDGDLLVADTAANVIYRLPAGGTWTTLVDGAGSSGGFAQPRGVAFGPDGSVLVTDGVLDVVRRLPPGGAWETVTAADGGTGGFSAPFGIVAAQDGTLFVGDDLAGVVRRLPVGGPWETVAMIDEAAWVALTPDESGLYATSDTVAIKAEAGVHLIGALETGGCVLQGGSTCTRDLQCDSGQCQADQTCMCVNELAVELTDPQGIALAPDGSLYVIENGDIDELLHIGTDGSVTTVIDASASSGDLVDPFGLALADDGTLYITEFQGSLLRLAPGGVWETVVDSNGSAGPAAGFRSVTVSKAGDVYVAVGDLGEVAWLPPGGAWQTLTAADAVFGMGVHIAVAPDGALWGSDAYTDAVRRRGAPGEFWELVTDSVGSLGVFSDPVVEAVTVDGTAYVLDSGHNAIKRLAPGGTWQALPTPDEPLAMVLAADQKTLWVTIRNLGVLRLGSLADGGCLLPGGAACAVGGQCASGQCAASVCDP
ncbi:MAG: hypothetical protein H6744_14945 [Deltaproteobacteria bacterium]|nr:hypothetical protein [Deltaproteobacteria bacterium]MCB9787980.1 hypothetical protein [Deltaproteobacteria bacterium]